MSVGVTIAAILPIDTWEVEKLNNLTDIIRKIGAYLESRWVAVAAAAPGGVKPNWWFALGLLITYLTTTLGGVYKVQKKMLVGLLFISTLLAAKKPGKEYPWEAATVASIQMHNEQRTGIITGNVQTVEVWTVKIKMKDGVTYTIAETIYKDLSSALAGEAYPFFTQEGVSVSCFRKGDDLYFAVETMKGKTLKPRKYRVQMSSRY